MRNKYIDLAAKYYVDRFSFEKFDGGYDLIAQSMLHGDARDVASGEEPSNVELEEICYAAHEKFIMEERINTNGGFISAILDIDSDPNDDDEVRAFSEGLSKLGSGKCKVADVTSLSDDILRWEFEETPIVEDVRGIMDFYTMCKVLGYSRVYLEVTTQQNEKYLLGFKDTYRWH